MKEIFYRRKLPHWQPLAASFFVTTRLHGSIPMPVLMRLREEKTRLLAEAKNDKEKIYIAHKRLFGSFDDALDNNRNAPYYLQQPEIAEVVTEALHFRDDKKIKLWSYTIMSNHIHLLITTNEANNEYLKKIMQDFKKFTGANANKLLGRTGNPFWQDEYYDHIVRDEAEFYRIENYILNNPVKAGLVEKQEDWRWSFCAP